MNGLSDFHCDTLTRVTVLGEGIYENSGQLDIKRLEIFDAPLLTFAVCLDGKGVNCFDETMSYIKYLQKLLEAYPKEPRPRLIETSKDTEKNMNEKRVSVLLAIEGGESLEGSLEKLEKFYAMGVRLLTLTWNKQNELAAGAHCDPSLGLTDFGRSVIKKLADLHMIADVSHLNDKSFWDICNTTEQSFVASHSNCREICANKRNLTNEQIKEIGRRRGLIGLNLFSDFIKEDGRADISDLIPHAENVIEQAGEDCLCLGADFDGVRSLPNGIKDISDLIKLKELFYLRYGEKITEKILCTNLRKYLNDFGL